MEIPDWLQTRTDLSEAYHAGNRYWFRTPVGLEHELAAEIRSIFPVKDLFVSHRNVVADIKIPTPDSISEKLDQIRTADDVYRWWGYCAGIDRTKASVESIVEFLEASLPDILPEAARRDGAVRITVSFVGKRNFNRFFVEEKVNTVFARRTALRPQRNEQGDPKVDGEFRLRVHIEEDVAFLGLAITDTPLHRRTWRNLRYTGQLHTPVAGAMARILAAGPDALIIDPFCGSGTILIESALSNPRAHFRGYDLSAEAIEIARKSAAAAGVNVDFRQGDSFKKNFGEEKYHLISNPPWDEKHQITASDQHRFGQRLGEMVLASQSAILLLPEELVTAIEKKNGIAFQLIAQTRIRGKLAQIVQYAGIDRQ